MKIKWETYIKETLASASFCIRFCLTVSIWCVGLQIGFSLVPLRLLPAIALVVVFIVHAIPARCRRAPDTTSRSTRSKPEIVIPL